VGRAGKWSLLERAGHPHPFLARIAPTLCAYRREIPEYLRWYNEKRPHMALQMQSLMDIIQSKCF